MGLGTTAALINAMTQKTEKELSRVKTAIQGKPDEKNSTKSNVGLDISDEDGYVVVRFEDGHIKTKKFDSKELFQNSTKSGVSLDIADPDGYVVARFKDGHIQTELFDSADIKYSSLKGKKIVNFGDSIFGNKRPPYDISTYIANETGATVYNCGFGGCRMATHDYSRRDTWGQFSMFELADAIADDDWTGQDAAIADTTWSERPAYFAETLALLKSIDFSEVDIVTIAYGTNDFTAAVTLDNANDNKDTSTFAGALRYSIETLLTAYPNLRIVCCGQTYRWWDSSGEFVDDSNDHEVGGQLLTQFVAKTEEVAKEYNLQFLNNYYIGIGKFTRSTFFTLPDTTHPNNVGTKLIATHMIKELY